MLGVRDEISAIATANGYTPREAFLARTETMLTATDSKLTASMFRDIQNHAPIEADQIIGDLIVRADAAKSPVPRLRVIYTHLKAYEANRS
jgi:2-dehydropantoate 2-reductase